MEDNINIVVNDFITRCYAQSCTKLQEIANAVDARIDLIDNAVNTPYMLEGIITCLNLFDDVPSIHIDITAQETLKTTALILANEFGAIITPTTISVDIDDVILSDDYEDIEHDFGGYTVILQNYPILHQHMSTRHYYTVVAKDNAKAYVSDNNTSYSHPHINSDILCEGEAAIAIRNALKAGDLVSFYLIVNSVVNTYNPEGAYRLLKHWLPSVNICHSCGAAVDDEDYAVCDTCNEMLCDGCYYECNCCNNLFCIDHIMHCDACDQDFCSYCYDEHITPCICCMELVCENKTHECGMCHNDACNDCIHNCSNCGVCVCNSCVIMLEPHHADQMVLFDPASKTKYYCPNCAIALGIKEE